MNDQISYEEFMNQLPKTNLLIEYFYSCGISHSQIIDYIDTLGIDENAIVEGFKTENLIKNNLTTQITSIFPDSRKSNPFPEKNEEFCFPLGYEVVRNKPPKLENFAYVLTDASGGLLYCFVLKVYDSLFDIYNGYEQSQSFKNYPENLFEFLRDESLLVRNYRPSEVHKKGEKKDAYGSLIVPSSDKKRKSISGIDNPEFENLIKKKKRAFIAKSSTFAEVEDLQKKENKSQEGITNIDKQNKKANTSIVLIIQEIDNSSTKLESKQEENNGLNNPSNNTKNEEINAQMIINDDKIKIDGTPTLDSQLNLFLENKINNLEGLESNKINNNNNNIQKNSEQKSQKNGVEASSDSSQLESLTNDFVMIMEERKDDDPSPQYPTITTKSMKSEIEKANLFLPYAICLISRYPFVESFSKLLNNLYSKMKNSISFPIEYYICYFVSRIPAPPKGFYKIQIEWKNCENIQFVQPPSNELPMLDIEFRHIALNFSVESIIDIFNIILLERQVN